LTSEPGIGEPFSHDREVVVDPTVHEAPVGQN